MHCEAEEVVKHARVGQGAVASLVRKAPPTSEGNTLPPPVGRPETPLGREYGGGSEAILGAKSGDEGIDVARELVEEDGKCNVPRDIGERLGSALLEQFLRYNSTNLRNSKLGCTSQA